MRRAQIKFQLRILIVYNVRAPSAKLAMKKKDEIGSKLIQQVYKWLSLSLSLNPELSLHN